MTSTLPHGGIVDVGDCRARWSYHGKPYVVSAMSPCSPYITEVTAGPVRL